MRWVIGGIVLFVFAVGAWAALRTLRPATDRQVNPVAAEFVARYIDGDGRIADTANGGISHSEGQGYGLLLAESANDRQAFDRVLAWTETHLAARDDGLFSWRWEPAEGKITDENNASDGEVLIAWALFRAHDRWGKRAYRRRALEIIEAVEDTVLRPTPFGTILLPGAAGFEHADGVVVNLSYWVFPAFDRFAEENRPVWAEVAQSGYRLADQAGFGEYGLPADWARIAPDGDVSPADGWPPEFGYNAVRVPLHVCWGSGSTSSTEDHGQLAHYVRFWADNPAESSDRWNIVTDAPAGGWAPPAYASIAALTAMCGDGLNSFPLPSIEPGEAYFSAALKGLVSIAVLDAQSRAQK